MLTTHISFIEKAQKYFQESDHDGQAFFYYFDFAEFKLVNRFYGVQGGDNLLADAEAYLDQLAAVAVYERIYSDQFVSIAWKNTLCSDEEVASSFGRFAEKFIAPRRSRYPACNLRIYCGICPIRNGNVLEAMDNANIAWREAKKNRVASVIFFDDSMLKALMQRQQAEREINEALQRESFTFCLQPKVDLITGEISGAEALARRVDANGQMTYPDQFLPIMEANGSVIELDRLILRQVCEQMNRRLTRGLPLVRTSVNLSRLHIQAPKSAEQLHAIVQEYHIPPCLIEFELTETILLDQFSGAKSLCDQLREIGYSMAIDDFGAGYAGVNIIQELDFDVLKLDRKFLAEEEPLRSRNSVIMPGLLNILRELNITALCEGVETAEQCRYLIRMGCQKVQGFYFSKPVPVEQFYHTYQALNGCYAIRAESAAQQ